MKGRKLRQFVMGGSISLLLFVGLAWYVAGELVAPATHDVGSPPPEYAFESIAFPSKSGAELAAWYLPSKHSKATVVLLHAIRGDRRAMLGRAKILHEAGFATLLVDQQAHGESSGENITFGYRERLDVMAAVDWVRNRNPEHRIGIVGWSLGGAAALLASPLDIDALVLESVYPTIEEAVRNRIAMRLGILSHLLAPALLVQLEPRLGISPRQLHPIDHVDKIGCPVLIAAGDQDQHTTLEESRKLYDAAQEPKEFVVFEGAFHQDLFDFDEAKYRQIVTFLDRHLNH
jgi:uncharacterized protein